MNTLSGPNIPAELETLYALRAERPELFALLTRMARLQLAKGHDYRTDDPSRLGNLLECEKMDVPAWKGILIRMSDKWSRLCTFCRQGLLEVKDETVEDSLLDMANYSLLCILAYQRAKAAEPKPQNGTTFRVLDPRSPAFDPKDTATWPLKEVPSALCSAMENPGRRGAAPKPGEWKP